MTPRRNAFEYFHKSVGYLCLFVAWATTLFGLWLVNAAIWMWIVILAWWIAIFVVFIALQKAGRAHDTYEAIWGDDPELPGNRVKTIGWGVKRKNMND
jgi:hypothetical protein